MYLFLIDWLALPILFTIGLLGFLFYNLCHDKIKSSSCWMSSALNTQRNIYLILSIGFLLLFVWLVYFIIF
jgi:hypothetical protein